MSIYSEKKMIKIKHRKMSIVQVFVQTLNTLILGLNIILLINIDPIPIQTPTVDKSSII